MIALPTVAIPTCVGAVFFGGIIAKIIGDPGLVGSAAICFFVGYLICTLTSRVTGWLLERFGLLPRDAWRVYPNATSWGGYLKKTGAL